MTLNKFLLAFAIAGAGVVAGCSTPTEITTKDGQTTMTADEPEINEDKGFVTYEKDGKEVRTNTSEVKQIEEVK
ncbi:YgdI/YgdR family lipoprotein [Pusillimonas sp. MFBS29]|uniref:YgdI/YgdR family lipoprotein n=1 Tax=Pusillimonas sp. MFBS29 TaxID=2886690 RepID=UPI001D12E07F|nr:YgdI/YgdR family lipoprotein [Pusillimonas sp. MFBS29]MCC2597240.1 YgdI/YgdR family lipoprotein [Pusillimonas sp. MFBS29]